MFLNPLCGIIKSLKSRNVSSRSVAINPQNETEILENILYYRRNCMEI